MIYLPNTQVLDSKTFRRPPLEDATRALPELYDFHSVASPNHPLFLFEDSPGNVRTILWPEAIRGIHRAAHRVASGIEYDVSSGSPPPVVAVLAISDTITCFCQMIGILRAGFTVFPISPRNSPSAVAHLLTKTRSSHLLISGEPSIRALMTGAIDILAKEGNSPNIQVSMMPVFEDLFPSGRPLDAPFEPFPPIKFNLDGPAFILHSSGSTDFPKAVLRSHRDLLQLAYTPWFGEIDLCGLVIGCHSVPMFHAMGVLQINLVASCGVVMSVFKPTSPATIPTPVNVLEGAVVTNSDLICCVPTFIEMWSRDPKNVETMKKMKGIMYGGGPLNKQIGDSLASAGVTIQNMYGSTECGVMSVFLLKNPGMDWEYFAVSRLCRPEFLPYSDGIVEIAMTRHETHTPRVVNLKIGGYDAYATQDLVVPHPSKPGLWKIYGRADDQVMLSTGEKTNAGPLETILSQDPRVQSAVIFGRGRFQNGVLIDPKKEFVFDPKDEASLANFRNAIWPTIERLNAFAPTHSRIFKEMILVASPSKPFTYTAKATARRQAIIAAYEPEINLLYDTVAETTQQEIPAPQDWLLPNSLKFVRDTVTKVIAKPIADHDDIFQYGCDSLQATWIRNSILRAVRQTEGPSAAKRIPDNLVYQWPSVTGLASAIRKCVLAKPDSQGSEVIAEKIQTLHAMVEKYTTGFPARPTTSTSPVFAEQPRDVILLTGSTGGFGSNILQHLAASDSVTHIYALNRRSPHGLDLAARQLEAFKERGLDASILSLPSVTLVEGDTSLPGLGIDSALLDEISSSVTHIIHNAWRVDFNLSLASFESNVRGLRNLMDLALSSPHAKPPRLTFISSIGVYRNFKAGGLAPESPITDPQVALGAGYTESKWVAERVLAAAAEQTALRPVVVRLGQITGDKSGTWNEREWFPSLVKSGVSLKCLPVADGRVSWIPSYDAAAALVEMRNADQPILHLVHPRPVPWSSIIEPIARSLGANLVSYQEWLGALEKSLDDSTLSEVAHMRRNPALRLLDFFRNADTSDDKEPLGIARLATDEAVRVSPTLKGSLKQLGDKDVEAWLGAWRKSGFI